MSAARCAAKQRTMLPICPICSSKAIDERTLLRGSDHSQMHIRQCSGCGHAVRLDDRGFEDNIKLQRGFFDKRARTPSAVPRWPQRFPLVAAQIGRLAGARGRALDVGCGPGVWLRVLADRGWEPFGVEVAHEVAQIARGFARADVFCGSLEEYKADPESFDLVTALALIEHLLDPRVLVDSARTLLRAGGLFVVMTGDRGCRHAAQAGDGWPYYWVDEHVSFFSAASLRRLISDAGFEVIRQEWRYSGFGRGPDHLTRYVAKAKEILGWNAVPMYNHVYVFARKLG
jgi:SAM-dependent methyltransferase